MKYLSTKELSPEKKAQWAKAVKRHYQPILRDPGASEEAKAIARKKLEAVRQGG